MKCAIDPRAAEFFWSGYLQRQLNWSSSIGWQMEKKLPLELLLADLSPHFQIQQDPLRRSCTYLFVVHPLCIPQLLEPAKSNGKSTMIGSMKAFATLAVLAVSWMSFSADVVNPVFKFGKPTYFGSGCPNASIQIVPATDAQSVSLMFSEYSATTSKSLTRDRKTCDLSVPIELLPGITIGIFKADYRGYAYVPDTPSAYLEFSASYFFAGSAGPSYKKRWNASTDEDVFISNSLTATAIAWSPCRPSTILRINTAIIASKPTLKGENPSIEIDTTDITVDRGIEFFLTYKNC